MIVEHILDQESWIQDLRRLLTPYDVFVVALHCPKDELARREAERGDRPPGSAARDFGRVHLGRVYDLAVHAPFRPQDAAAHVLAQWQTGRRVSEFANRAP